MERYDQQKVVGQGSYGKAILCKRKSDAKLCIIKQISLSKMSPKEAKLTEQEATLLARLRHPNIVAFWESFLSKNQLHIVMEYADGGDLDNYIKTFAKNNRGKLIPEKQVMNLFVQICLAIKHIHDRKILHRDLKSQNIFLTSSGLCKLGDFGVSKVLRNTVELASTQIGTPYYMSPEIMENQRYNSKTDIWSLGCILYEMMCQRLPFGGNSMKQLCHNIAHAAPSPPSSSYSQELRDLVRDTLIKNPKQRPGINSILGRPVVRVRIAAFLGETKIQTEFSHTVLHGVDVLRSAEVSNAKIAAAQQAAVANVARQPSIAVAAAVPLSVAGKPSAAPPDARMAAALHLINNRPTPSPCAGMAPPPSRPYAYAPSPVPPVANNNVRPAPQYIVPPPAGNHVVSSAVRDKMAEVAELQRQQQLAQMKEAQARRVSDALMVQEKERLRLRAVEKMREAAVDNDRKIREVREQLEVQKRVREREAEMQRIRVQQQQLISDQKLAAKRKEAEAERAHMYGRPAGKPSEPPKRAPNPAYAVYQAAAAQKQNYQQPVPVVRQGQAHPAPVPQRQAAVVPAPYRHAPIPVPEARRPSVPQQPIVVQQHRAAPVRSREQVSNPYFAILGEAAVVRVKPSAAAAPVVVRAPERKPEAVMRIPERKPEVPIVVTKPHPSREIAPAPVPVPVPVAVKQPVAAKAALIKMQLVAIPPFKKKDTPVVTPVVPVVIAPTPIVVAPIPAVAALPSPVPSVVVAPQTKSPTKESRAVAAEAAVRQAQEVIKVVEQERMALMSRHHRAAASKSPAEDVREAFPATRETDSPVSDDSSDAENDLAPLTPKAQITPQKKKPVAEPVLSSRASPARDGPWLSQLEAQMGQLQNQVKQIQVAKSPAPSPVPAVAPSSISSTNSSNSSSSNTRLSFPMAQPSEPKRAVPSVAAVPSSRRVSADASSLYKKSLTPAVVAAVSSSKDKSPRASVGKSTTSAADIMQQHKAEKKRQQQNGFRDFLKAQREAQHQKLQSSQSEPLIDFQNESEQTAAAVSPIKPAVSAVLTPVVTISARSDAAAGRSLAPVNKQSPVVTGPVSGVEEKKKMHDAQREDLRKLMKAQKQALLRERENGWSNDTVVTSPRLPEGIADHDEEQEEEGAEEEASVVQQEDLLSMGEEDEDDQFESSGSFMDFSPAPLGIPIDQHFLESPLLGDTFISMRNGGSFLAPESFVVHDEQLIIDEATALEYSMMLNQMQAILLKPTPTGGHGHPSPKMVHSPLEAPIDPIEEGDEDVVCEGEDDDDEFEEESVDAGDDDEEDEEAEAAYRARCDEEDMLSENFSDDDREITEDDELFVDVRSSGGLRVTGSQESGSSSLTNSVSRPSSEPRCTLSYSKSLIKGGAVRRASEHFSDFEDDECEGNGSERESPNDPLSLVATPQIMSAINQNNISFQLSDSYNAADEHLSSSGLMDEEYLSRITHLRAYLLNQLGEERFCAGMDFLSSIHLQKAGGAAGAVEGQHQGEVEEEEDDEELLNDLEGVIGADGLHFLDDMFQLITLEARSAPTSLAVVVEA